MPNKYLATHLRYPLPLASSASLPSHYPRSRVFTKDMVRLHSPSRRAPESITNGIMICGSRSGKRYHISLIAIIMLRFLYFRNDTPAHHKLIAKQPPSLAIVSTCIPGPRFSYEYIYVSHINKRDYCEKYNATCILPDQQLETNSNLHKKWDKLYHIKNTLETKPYIDWVLWMDCDAAFTNFGKLLAQCIACLFHRFLLT